MNRTEFNSSDFCKLTLLVIHLSYYFAECRELNVTGCLEEYHNASNPRRVRLVCNQGEMLRIKKAFLAAFDAPLQAAHRWCDNPSYDSSHCKQYESQLTDDFIRTCNTISVCSVNQYHTALPDCQSTGFDPQMARRTYIHVEFDCLPRKLHSSLSTYAYFSGGLVYIMNIKARKYIPIGITKRN